jgi:hypothetical protein
MLEFWQEKLAVQRRQLVVKSAATVVADFTPAPRPD